MGDTLRKSISGKEVIMVVWKINGKMKELATIGIARSEGEVDIFLKRGKEWIDREQPADFFLILSCLGTLNWRDVVVSPDGFGFSSGSEKREEERLVIDGERVT